MLLCEEYLQRNTLTVPLVRHMTTNEFMFWFWKESWHLYEIHWHGPDMHPGYYTLRAQRVNRNCAETGRYFVGVSEKQVQWDEYEGELLKWTESLTGELFVPSTKDAVKQASWEMVLMNCDKALVEHINVDLLMKSVDPDVSDAERNGAIDACVQYFRSAGSSGSAVVQAWNHYKQFREHYATWLAELVCALHG